MGYTIIQYTSTDNGQTGSTGKRVNGFIFGAAFIRCYTCVSQGIPFVGEISGEFIAGKFGQGA